MVDYIEPVPLAALDAGDLLDDVPSPGARATSLAPDFDGVIIDGLLTTEECGALVHAAESTGAFAFWDPAGGEERRSVRNADTLEFDSSALCAALWKRLSPHVPERMSFSRDDLDEDRYEPDLDGEWVATGLNTHLLINRYAAGGHFAPHADGSTLIDFNHRSLYTVLIYLNECVDGGGTQLLSSACGDATETDERGARVAKPEAVVRTCRPHAGRALCYYHQVCSAFGDRRSPSGVGLMARGCACSPLQGVRIARAPPSCPPNF